MVCCVGWNERESVEREGGREREREGGRGRDREGGRVMTGNRLLVFLLLSLSYRFVPYFSPQHNCSFFSRTKWKYRRVVLESRAVVVRNHVDVSSLSLSLSPPHSYSLTLYPHTVHHPHTHLSLAFLYLCHSH